MFSTSLNPNLHDPDMTMFFNARGPPYYNYKKASPPPSYRSSRACKNYIKIPLKLFPFSILTTRIKSKQAVSHSVPT